MRLTRASASRLAGAALLLMLAGCAAENEPATAAASTPPHPRIPIQQFLPDTATPPASPPTGTAAAPAPGDETTTGTPLPERENDPSAPLDTPLCGRAEREAIAASAAISPAVIAGAGACAETACFDPLTATYIGADGARHVCQE